MFNNNSVFVRGKKNIVNMYYLTSFHTYSLHFYSFMLIFSYKSLDDRFGLGFFA